MRLGSKPLPGVAARLSLGWVLVYTLGLPAASRTKRRMQVDSDAWEHRNQRLSEGASLAAINMEILQRTARGIADDIRWRMNLEESLMTMKIGLGLTMLTLLAIDFLEFHDVFEAKTVPEYLTGIVSIPVLAVLLALFIGLLRFQWQGADRETR